MKYICTRSFQYRGTMIKAGTALELNEDELKDGFVSAHVDVYAKDAEREFTLEGAPVAKTATRKSAKK